MASRQSELTNEVPLHALTLAICSNRLHNIRKHWRENLDSLAVNDELLVVLDVAPVADLDVLEEELNWGGVRVISNRHNLGLATSRNVVLENCRTNYLVFIDDDVILCKETLRSIRNELERGYHIVGVRICGPPKGLTIPWYISNGQLHYLGIHNSRSFHTWGACRGINLAFVRGLDLRFREELGRKGSGLQSGDDTTFLKEMKARGAKEAFLNEAHVSHDIDIRRLSLSYMIRRAYWQGRSEIRRGNGLAGLRKEWFRFFDSETRLLKRISLSFLYMTAVCIGILIEKMGRLLPYPRSFLA